MLFLANRFKVQEQAYPFLVSQRSFPLDRPPLFKTFSFLFELKKEALLDPWETPYFYDGVNGLLHSAGPDGFFRYQNGSVDDLFVSIKPYLYVDKVALLGSPGNKKELMIRFNRKLGGMWSLSPSSVNVAIDSKGGHTDIKVVRANILKGNYGGFVSIQLASQLSDSVCIFCRLDSLKEVFSKATVSKPVDVIHFQDFTYSFLKGTNSKTLKRYNVVRIREEEIQTALEKTQQWFK